MCKIDKFSRYQKDINLIDYAPNVGNTCACGCGIELTGRKKRWASSDCSTRAYESFSIIKGNTSAIRKALFSIDSGYCRMCGVYDQQWQADHIIPVAYGGGGSDISNFQTLCLYCHFEKTNAQRVGHLATISSHAAVIADMSRLYARGAVANVPWKMSNEIHALLSITASK